ncbi:7939_t:CDS:10 [Diversispora eburnea]|uniref:7939_t:CDS:1 n=1 Tax=Diversispora eburnea TaxID=1213867 RepID=A0A9N9GL33_9GLOM|nr:7939_t:CDS:10 [Diversispora eburnea]
MSESFDNEIDDHIQEEGEAIMPMDSSEEEEETDEEAAKERLYLDDEDEVSDDDLDPLEENTGIKIARSEPKFQRLKRGRHQEHKHDVSRIFDEDEIMENQFGNESDFVEEPDELEFAEGIEAILDPSALKQMKMTGEDKIVKTKDIPERFKEVEEAARIIFDNFSEYDGTDSSVSHEILNALICGISTIWKALSDLHDYFHHEYSRRIASSSESSNTPRHLKEASFYEECLNQGIDVLEICSPEFHQIQRDLVRPVQSISESDPSWTFRFLRKHISKFRKSGLFAEIMAAGRFVDHLSFTNLRERDMKEYHDFIQLIRKNKPQAIVVRCYDGRTKYLLETVQEAIEYYNKRGGEEIPVIAINDG